MTILEIIGAFALFFIIVVAALVTSGAGAFSIEAGDKKKIWGNKDL